MHLELRNLTLRYGERAALSDLSVVARGDTVALLGANGSGKTSLLRILAGLDAPTAGQALIDGEPVIKGRNPAVSYLPQETGFFPLLQRPAETLSLGLRLRGIDDPESPGRLLAALGLEDEDRSPEGYSGGMKQKLRIAQALVHAPRVLLLDEPTTGLDVRERFRVLRLIEQLRDRVSVLFATHAPQDAAAIADQVVILDNGRRAGAGTPAELARWADGFVYEVRLTGTRLPASTGYDIVAADRDGDVLTLRVVGSPPPGGRLVPPTLEDAYVLLTRRRSGGEADSRPGDEIE